MHVCIILNANIWWNFIFILKSRTNVIPIWNCDVGKYGASSYCDILLFLIKTVESIITFIIFVFQSRSGY